MRALLCAATSLIQWHLFPTNGTFAANKILQNSIIMGYLLQPFFKKKKFNFMGSYLEILALKSKDET